jgi:hypothetical protein
LVSCFQGSSRVRPRAKSLNYRAGTNRLVPCFRSPQRCNLGCIGESSKVRPNLSHWNYRRAPQGGPLVSEVFQHHDFSLPFLKGGGSGQPVDSPGQPSMAITGAHCYASRFAHCTCSPAAVAHVATAPASACSAARSFLAIHAASMHRPFVYACPNDLRQLGQQDLEVR